LSRGAGVAQLCSSHHYGPDWYVLLFLQSCHNTPDPAAPAPDRHHGPGYWNQSSAPPFHGVWPARGQQMKI
jgi:hypothetical protein